MNDLVFAERINGKVQYYYLNGKSINDNLPGESVLASRPDFDIKFVKLPPLRENDIEDYLKYKIRSLYPGDPDKTVFDYDIIKGKRGKYAVLYITLRETIGEYKKNINLKPLLLPFNIVRNIASGDKNNNLVIFWHNSWIEIMVFNGGILHSSVLIRREKDGAHGRYKLKEILPEKCSDFNLMCFCSESCKEKAGIWIKDYFKINKQPVFFYLESIKEKQIFNPNGIFVERKKKRKLLSKIILYMLSGIAIVLVLSILNKLKTFEKEYYDNLTDYYSRIKRDASDVSALENKINIMEKQLNELNGRRPVDPYWVLANISLVLQNRAKIKSFVLEGLFFRIEAIGKNPMEMMEKFNKSSGFNNVRLIKVIPSVNDKDIFVITGNVNVK